MNAVTVLTRARDLIARPNGWCQGDYRRVVPVSPEIYPQGAVVAYCALGAIEAALGGRPGWLALTETLTQAIGVDYTSIAQWNDFVYRTQEEVIAAFDRAIALAREGEAARG